jgi:hypothetical protein
MGGAPGHATPLVENWSTVRPPEVPALEPKKTDPKPFVPPGPDKKKVTPPLPSPVAVLIRTTPFESTVIA